MLPPVALGIATIVAARWLAFGAPTARELAGGVAAIVVPAAVVGFLLERREPLAAAAVVLACSATVLAAAADGRWHGIVALAMVALAAWSHRRSAAVLLALLGLAALLAWWRSGFDRENAPGPSWREVAGETGSLVRRSLSSVGFDERLAPLSGVLLWWLGVGLMVGGLLVAGRASRAAWLPATLAMLVVGGWAIALVRGPVDPVGGTWLVAVGIVLTAKGVGGDGAAPRRTASAVAFAASAAWASSFARELRAESTTAAALAVLGAMAVAAAVIAPVIGPLVAEDLSGSADAEHVG